MNEHLGRHSLRSSHGFVILVWNRIPRRGGYAAFVFIR